MAKKQRKAKDEREIRTADGEMKAIVVIRKALDGLDTQSKGRVLTYCIDRARQEFERDATKQVAKEAAKLGALTGQGQARAVVETEPELPEPPTTPAPEPEPEVAHA